MSLQGAPGGRRLGLIRPPNLAQVEQIGTFPAPVWQADWVARRAHPVGVADGGESTETTGRTP